MSGLAILAVLCVACMGYAIQRGGTCTVAAIDEILTQRRATRLVAMLEAALVVAGVLVLAHLLHRMGGMPPAFALSAWTLWGGIPLCQHSCRL